MLANAPNYQKHVVHASRCETLKPRKVFGCRLRDDTKVTLKHNPKTDGLQRATAERKHEMQDKSLT